jgi:hypothetical protein
MDEVRSDFPTISEAERRLAGIYDELITRYSTLPPAKSIPMQAVRLFALRVGFDTMMRILQHEDYGVPVVAERCRHEITLRQEFCARMLVLFPPDNPEGIEIAAAEMAADLAASESEAGQKRLMDFLERLLKRARTQDLRRARVGALPN